MHEAQKHNAEASLLNFLSYRPRSRYEIEQYLKKRGYNQNDIDALIGKYQSMGYINDFEFAAMWIRERMRFKPKGYNGIYSELRAKGVAKTVIDKAWEEANIDESTVAEELINHHFDKFNKKAMPKAMAFLLRRGFSRSLAYNVVNKFFIDLMDEDKT